MSAPKKTTWTFLKPAAEADSFVASAEAMGWALLKRVPHPLHPDEYTCLTFTVPLRDAGAAVRAVGGNVGEK